MVMEGLTVSVMIYGFRDGTTTNYRQTTNSSNL